MKKIAFILFCLLCWAVGAIGQTPMVPAKAGMELKFEHRDSKGNITEYTLVRMDSAEKTARGTVLTMSTTSLTAAGVSDENSPKVSHKVLVTERQVIYPKDGMLPPMEGHSIEASVSGDDIVYPYHPSPGDDLPAYSITISAGVGSCGCNPGEDCEHEHDQKNGGRGHSMTLTSVERTVGQLERITTPAGTFLCTVIREDVRAKAMMGLFNRTSRALTWYAPGIGEVQRHELDRRGRVESTSQLISVSYGR